MTQTQTQNRRNHPDGVLQKDGTRKRRSILNEERKRNNDGNIHSIRMRGGEYQGIRTNTHGTWVKISRQEFDNAEKKQNVKKNM